MRSAYLSGSNASIVPVTLEGVAPLSTMRTSRFTSEWPRSYMHVLHHQSQSLGGSESSRQPAWNSPSQPPAEEREREKR